MELDLFLSHTHIYGCILDQLGQETVQESRGSDENLIHMTDLRWNTASMSLSHTLTHSLSLSLFLPLL